MVKVPLVLQLVALRQTPTRGKLQLQKSLPPPDVCLRCMCVNNCWLLWLPTDPHLRRFPTIRCVLSRDRKGGIGSVRAGWGRTLLDSTSKPNVNLSGYHCLVGAAGAVKKLSKPNWVSALRYRVRANVAEELTALLPKMLTIWQGCVKMCKWHLILTSEKRSDGKGNGIGS